MPASSKERNTDNREQGKDSNSPSVKSSTREASGLPFFWRILIMVKVAIFGASGYTGQELTRILLGHPDVQLVAATSRRFAGLPIADVFPSLYGLSLIH